MLPVRRAEPEVRRPVSGLRGRETTSGRHAAVRANRRCESVGERRRRDRRF